MTAKRGTVKQRSATAESMCLDSDFYAHLTTLAQAYPKAVAIGAFLKGHPCGVLPFTYSPGTVHCPPKANERAAMLAKLIVQCFPGDLLVLFRQRIEHELVAQELARIKRERDKRTFKPQRTQP